MSRPEAEGRGLSFSALHERAAVYARPLLRTEEAAALDMAAVRDPALRAVIVAASPNAYGMPGHSLERHGPSRYESVLPEEIRKAPAGEPVMRPALPEKPKQDRYLPPPPDFSGLEALAMPLMIAVSLLGIFRGIRSGIRTILGKKDPLLLEGGAEFPTAAVVREGDNGKTGGSPSPGGKVSSPHRGPQTIFSVIDAFLNLQQHIVDKDPAVRSQVVRELVDIAEWASAIGALGYAHPLVCEILRMLQSLSKDENSSVRAEVVRGLIHLAKSAPKLWARIKAGEMLVNVVESVSDPSVIGEIHAVLEELASQFPQFRELLVAELHP